MADSLLNAAVKILQEKSDDKMQLPVINNDVNSIIPAMSKDLVEERYFLFYEPPKLHLADGNKVIGAREHWIELVTYINDDLNWLIKLPYHKFWSNVVYNPKIKQSIRVFLQNTPQFYNLDDFPSDAEMNKLLNKAFQNVLIIIARLVTNNESPTEFVEKSALGTLLYNNYIFTIPMILDICQHYGRENKKVVSKIMESIFSMQPLYLRDMKETVSYITKIFQSVEERLEDYSISLPDEGLKSPDVESTVLEVSLRMLEDIILRVLDLVSTIGIFLQCYPLAIAPFKNENFITTLVSTYANALPEMYKKLNLLASHDDFQIERKCFKLKHFLDVTRMESLELFRFIMYKDIDNILESPYPLPEEEVSAQVDQFLKLMSSALGETEFLIDYNHFFPIEVDVTILTHICPTIDPVKIDYVSHVAALTETRFEDSFEEVCNENGSKSAESIDTISEDRLVTLVTEVKDILSDLDEEFIVKCLKYYDFNSESVINAVLENNLPPEFMSEGDTSTSAQTNVCSNNSNNDDLTSPENIDRICHEISNVITSAGIREEKKVYNYDNIDQMMNDKDHIKHSRDLYNRYSLISDEYEDEYDDTYDSQDMLSNVDDSTEVDKPFTMLKGKNAKQCENADESEDEENAEDAKNPNHFLQDPAKLRAEAAARALSKRGRGRGGGYHARRDNDAAGKSKSSDQEKGRDFKNKHKSSVANHNRRAGASYKKRQGIIPS